MSEYVLQIEKLCMSYGSQQVLNELSLNVEKGSIYGFLGRNGAGKSTAIRNILGLLKPRSGHIRLFGTDTASRGGRMQLRNVGSLVETPGFYDHLSGYDNLAIACMVRDLPESAITEALHLTNMSQAASKLVGRYSLGMRQRLGISWALLGNPQLLILDEPINGLDPAGVREVRALLRRLRDDRGVTIFLSSHILSEIQQVTDRIGIVHDGHLVAEHDTAGCPAQELEDYFLRLTEGNEIA
ncbi:MAG TPA: ABC transporter ATP-binding protein [Firmicutes bacterium]|nr:ABC transporter ATP-binding protein [Bacillota bacterium]